MSKVQWHHREESGPTGSRGRKEDRSTEHPTERERGAFQEALLRETLDGEAGLGYHGLRFYAKNFRKYPMGSGNYGETLRKGGQD